MEDSTIQPISRNRKILLAVWEIIKTIITVAVLTLIIRYFLIQPYIIDGESMAPNFHHSEYLLTDKLSYRFREPARGEVIIFHPPQDPGLSYIKRVIGLPGDSIQIKDKKVFVNGKELNESYLPGGIITQPLAGDDKSIDVHLGPAEFYVMGDNRAHSKDSRDPQVGPIPKLNIVGRAMIVLLPTSDFGLVKKPVFGN